MMMFTFGQAEFDKLESQFPLWNSKFPRQTAPIYPLIPIRDMCRVSMFNLTDAARQAPCVDEFKDLVLNRQ